MTDTVTPPADTPSDQVAPSRRTGSPATTTPRRRGRRADDAAARPSGRPDDTITPPSQRPGGGELLSPTDDEAPGVRRPAGGPLFEALAGAAGHPGTRVLIAGPHSTDLVARVADTGADVTCLLRSYADSAALAARFDGAAVRVFCGGLDTLRAEDPADGYDVVVALDGVPRLSTVERDDRDWGGAMELLLAAVRPGGRLILALENLLGIHRLVEVAPAIDDSDDEGSSVGAYDDSRPRSYAQLRDWLERRELRIGSSFAGYPAPTAPTVLLGTGGVAAEAALRGHLDSTLAAACGAGFSGTPVLSDPRQLATTALRSGLGVELAPLWVVVAGRGDTEVPPLDIPEILVADGADIADGADVADVPDVAAWGVRYAITPGPAGSWQRVMLGAVAPCTADGVRRDPAQLAGPVPAGRLLEEELIAGCLRRDLPALRSLLGGYASWLAGRRDERGRLTGADAFGTPRATVVVDGWFALLDPSWSLVEPVAYEVALARGLRQFAVELIMGGYTHPWPAGTDADGLTVLLAGLAGCDLDRTVVRQAVDAEVAIAAALRGLSPDARAAYAARLVTVDAGSPPLDVDSHRKLHQSVRRLREQLALTRSKVEWYEQMLASRERSLATAEQALDLLSGSVSYRIGRLLTLPFRWVGFGVRRVLRLR